MPKKTLVIITGPSRVGKTTIIDKLLEIVPSSARFVTTTTRPPRPKERDGVDYYFRSREEFKAGIESGEFIEWVESYGHFYGTSRIELSRLMDSNSVLFAATDTRGVVSLKQEFPQAVTVFVRPGSMEELEKRIANSTELTPDSIQKRMAAITDKMRRAGDFDYLVTNAEGKLGDAVQAIFSILKNHTTWRIGFDLDGVVIDHTANKISVAERLGIRLAPRETPSNIMKMKVDPQIYRKIKKTIYGDLSVELLAPIMLGAENVLAKLKTAKFPLFLISIRPTTEEPIAWLKNRGLWEKYFDSQNAFFVKERVEKDEIARKLMLDIFLDDEPSTLRTMPSVPKKFLFDPYGVYPENLESYAVVSGWKEFADVILSL